MLKVLEKSPLRTSPRSDVGSENKIVILKTSPKRQQKHQFPHVSRGRKLVESRR